MNPGPNPFDAPASDVDYPQYVEAPTDADLADRGKRLAGAILDSVILIVVAIPAIALGVAEQVEAAVIVGVIAVFGLTGYQWFLIATTGQSIAKKLLGMKIVREDGSDIDFVTGVILRIWAITAMGFIPFVGSFIGIVDGLMIFGETQQCLHDKIAKTRVIDVGPI